MDKIKLFKSIRSRIIGLVLGVIFITSILIVFLINRQTKATYFNSYNNYASSLVNFLKLSVSNQYRSIEFYKKSVLEIRKDELEQKVDITFTIIQKYYQHYKIGKCTKQEAQERASKEIEAIRYDDEVGYFWINNTDKPYPIMIMHPTLPELNGTVLNNPEYNCAIGKELSLFKAFVDVCDEFGEGYVEYLWPKPTSSGLSDKQPKISYVRIFKPWDWIIGTGIYIDDIQQHVNSRLNAVERELNEGIQQLVTGREGNVFIFNGEGNILVHSFLKGYNLNEHTNKLTGNAIFSDFVEASKREKPFVDYYWTKTTDTANLDFVKRAYVSYFEPLDWYIASAYFYDQISDPVEELRKKSVYIVLALSILALLIAVFMANSITKPIYELSKMVMKVEKEGVGGELPPLKGSSELIRFRNLLNTMMISINNTQEDLVKAKTKADESNRLKSAFLANMSHEIRTPLNGVVGFTQIISDPDIDNKERIRYSEIISKSSMQLLRVVNDIIDISKIETGQIIIESELINLEEFFDELYEVYLPISEDKGIKLIKDTSGNKNTSINSDYTKLRQILDNLLNNAFKFTEQGNVTFGYANKPNKIEFYVKDTGIGLNREDQEIIFDRFTQAKNQLDNNNRGGTGLGLSISKAFVDIMKGEFWVESQVNVGTNFYFSIPQKK